MQDILKVLTRKCDSVGVTSKVLHTRLKGHVPSLVRSFRMMWNEWNAAIFKSVCLHPLPAAWDNLLTKALIAFWRTHVQYSLRILSAQNKIYQHVGTACSLKHSQRSQLQFLFATAAFWHKHTLVILHKNPHFLELPGAAYCVVLILWRLP